MEIIAGVDEVGRGPLAGPVLAAAVILPDDHTIEGLRDSKELSKIKDPVKFAFELGKLENQLKVSPRKKAAPAPEAKITAGGKGEDTALDKLRAKGNFKDIVAYRRKLRSQKTG